MFLFTCDTLRPLLKKKKVKVNFKEVTKLFRLNFLIINDF